MNHVKNPRGNWLAYAHNATDANQTFMGGLTFKFLQDGAYPPFHTVTVPSGQVCEASADWLYPNDNNAHTVTVNIEYANGTVKYMVEPITLEAYRDTRLLFWVERDNSSKHIFHGKLVTTDGVVVASQPIKAYLNDTQIETGLATDAYGCFTFERNFNPSDQKVTYTVQVSFEGTGSLSAMLNATALDGTRYTVCQTTQFNYRPSANMTQIVVEPQATQVTVPTKTAEEMQQEAQDNGELRTYTWSGIWFPWFRMHFVAALNGQDLLDVGLSVLWSDIVIVYPRLQSWILDAINTVVFSSIAKALLIGWIGAEVAVYFGMQFGPALFAVALAASVAFKGVLLGLYWGDSNGLKGSFVGALFSWAYGLITSLKALVDLGIACLTDFLKLSDANLWKLLYKFLYIPINMIFLIEIILHIVELGGWTW